MVASLKIVRKFISKIIVSFGQKSFKSHQIIQIFCYLLDLFRFVRFGFLAILLRTSAIQASLMALGLASVLRVSGLILSSYNFLIQFF